MPTKAVGTPSIMVTVDIKSNKDKAKNHQGKGSSCLKNQGNVKKFEGKCYNCRKKSNMAKVCWLQKKFVDSNAATSKTKEEWEIETLFATEEEKLALTATTPDQIDYEKDWIVDLTCSNHMTGDKRSRKICLNIRKPLVVTANNSIFPISHIGIWQSPLI